jgi:segregation and condensation protein A
MDQLLPTTNFNIATAAYTGPFELVIELIEKRKLLVNDLSLAAVTDEFIQHVRGQAEFPIEQTTNFIAIAATLLLIKSKSLLPDLVLTEEEEGDIDDFQKRLAEYEKYRELSRELGKLFGRRVLVARGEQAPDVIFAPSKDMTLTRIEEALMRALEEREKVEELPEARVKPLITIEEMMNTLAERVQSALTLSFNDFSGMGKKEKVEVIVSFLALLELVKQGAVEAAQYGDFTDIRITNTTATSVPRYG